jgi:radical SAM superfamily enzyme YgiQ (UPF0313 family)
MIKKERILIMTPNTNGVKGKIIHIQPSLGPMIMGSVLRERGYEVFIHDSALEGWDNKEYIDDRKFVVGQTNEKIAEAISNYNPMVFGISALFSNSMNSAHNIANIAKKVNPKIKIVFGGNHISNSVLDYKYAQMVQDSNIPLRLPDMEDENIDCALIGESDFGFANLIDKIIAKEDISKMPGLVMRKDSLGLEYIMNNPLRILNLAQLPKPARDLVNMEKYFEVGSFHLEESPSSRVVNVMASRGCLETCTFCSTPQMWGNKIRWRIIDDILEEILDAKVNYNVGEIQFEDDNLTASLPKLLELCKGLEKIGLPWCTPNGTKINYHMSSQPEMYNAMRNSGCYQVTIACESGSQRVLDDVLHKNLKLEQIKPTIDNIKKAGMFVHTFWILGVPGETYEEIQKTIDFAMESGADSYSFAIYNPLPGTIKYREVMKNNLWWDNKDISSQMYQSSLIRVPGFNGPEEFERFVAEAVKKANSLLKDKNPERYNAKRNLLEGKV